jgi:hypothetical protein
MNKIHLRSTVRPEDTFTLTDLSKKELTLIFQSRKLERDGKLYTYIFACCIAVSFLLAVMLTQWFHSPVISSICFFPIIAYFVTNALHNRQIKLDVEDMIRQAEKRQGR